MYISVSYSDWQQVQTPLNGSHLLISRVDWGLTRWPDCTSSGGLKKMKGTQGNIELYRINAYVKSILLWLANRYSFLVEC